MFGYVRPLKGELKVRDWEAYRACYCGLCHTLRERYGLWACLLVRYDAAVLAAWFWDGEIGPVSMRRCPGNPLRKKCACAVNQALERAADITILLMHAKLLDAAYDNRGPKSWLSSLAALLLKKARRKAAANLPQTAELALVMTETLRAYEKQNEASLDRMADTFAKLLAAAAGERVLSELCYHIGRWIYLIDACDDLAKDAKKRNYNAVASRFGLSGGCWTEESRAAMDETSGASLAAAASALVLLPVGGFTPLVHNVVYFGLPAVQREILYGNGECRRKNHRKRRKSQ